MVSMAGRPLRYPELADRMGETLHHRGPDNHGLLTSPVASLGVQRLRIIDIAARADQPFTDPSGLVWLACNGEIYNASEIRGRYSDYPYRSSSDVESILPLYLQKGIAGVSELDGMFGIAIWDSRIEKLFLVRDRAGEKPLFYAEVDGEIWFASEIQALLEHPTLSREIDHDSVRDFLSLGYVLEPKTLFRGIRRVEAGSFHEIDSDGAREHRYWDASSFAVQPTGPADAEEQLAELFEAAVERQTISDAPIGVFMSGGLDSSLLAALVARRVGADRIHTYTARFTEESYDESVEAEVFARSLGTHHVSVPAGIDELLLAVENVVNRIAEPMADPAVLPTWLLARRASKDVRVVLAGEGADELFGGYPTYLGHKFAPIFGGLPSPLRRGISRAVGLLPSSQSKVPLEFLLKRFVTGAELPWLERHLRWFGTGAPWSENRFEPEYGSIPDALAGAMLLDYHSYLRDNLLVKIDRATMLESVESRAPYLDRALTRFAFSLPTALRLRGTETKWLLKRASLRWLPRELVYRRKRGLSVPVASMINHQLSGDVDRLLLSPSMEEAGWPGRASIERLLAEHRSGHANHARAIWPLYMLLRWAERWNVSLFDSRRAEDEPREARFVESLV